MRPLTQSSPEDDPASSLLQLSIALSDPTAGKKNHANTKSVMQSVPDPSSLVKGLAPVYSSTTGLPPSLL